MVNAERPRGTTVFKDLSANPPTSEEEFTWLWKVYILTLIAQKLREYNIQGAEAKKLYDALEQAGLLKRTFDLSGLLRAAQHLVRSLLQIEVQGGVELNEATFAPSEFVGKISLREPSFDLRQAGFNSVNDLLFCANEALKNHGYSTWVLLDRLDVAFAENHTLEANALRALLKVYNDVRGFDHISLKVFLREDIWRRIFRSGFREASHITKYAILDWNESTLLNLLIRKLLSNKALVADLDIDPKEVLLSSASQEQLFNRLFPDQVEQGINKSTTFKWMVSRCADATEQTAPRELIHLLNSLLEKEIQRLEKGGTPAPEGQLFDRAVFKPALGPVSDARLRQYLYAEYPDHKPYIDQLEHQKTEQSPESLSKIWSITGRAAAERAEQLRDLGFFQRRGSRDRPTYWVPFLYRNALNMIQGRAEEEEDKQGSLL